MSLPNGTDISPSSGNVTADAVQQSGKVVEVATAEKTGAAASEDAEVVKDDKTKKPEKPQANIGNYFVRDYPLYRCSRN
jgi:hypothetical protein